jgi:hypothetical protein
MPSTWRIAMPPLDGGGIVRTSQPATSPASGAVIRGRYDARSARVIVPPSASDMAAIASAISPS